MTNSKDLIIVAPPRSGNTMLARMLGDALDSPVTGWGPAHPIGEEGLDRPGAYTVRQLHLHPDYGSQHGEFIVNSYTAAVKCWNGERVILILRDPRDIVVSAMHYWEIGGTDIHAAVEAVGSGLPPLVNIGPLQKYVLDWLDVKEFPVARTRYEDFVNNGAWALWKLLCDLNIFDVPYQRVIESARRQSFGERKKEIEQNGDKYMYGKTVQMKHMRKGIAGDWRNHFDYAASKRAEELFGDLMYSTGYTDSRDWSLHMENTLPFNAEQRSILVELYMEQFPDPLDNPRMKKDATLFQLAKQARDGVILEIGAYHGNGTISLAWGSQAGMKLPVFTVDDYVERTGWAGEKYGDVDRIKFLENMQAARVSELVSLLHMSSDQAVKTWDTPVALVYWDLWTEMQAHFDLWGKWVTPGGLYAVHEPGDHKFGGDKLVRSAIASGVWEDYREYPGYVWSIRRTE